MSEPSTGRNRLAGETSPYLLQHASNPVDWYPWGEEALERARREDKPILLSIGYSACHWCHVMAHESFEDEATARVMNERFVNVKVDREERPDLDRIYQIAHQMLTQRGGGWPLTMFLAPHDQRPFFGGTYFPKEPRFGMPAFVELLERVSDFYRTRRDDVQAQNTALVAALDELVPPAATDDVALTDEPLRAAREALEEDFDRQWGGFGGAPKFPHPATIERLLRAWHATAGSPAPDLQALFMASLTLTRMAEGGLRDQLGGGFFRYSVDAWWMIPHFEKMLYDNGQLLAVYAQAAIATGEPLFAEVAGSTADWMLREMRDPEGGFHSSLDADSEGEEGRYYVWDRDEIARRLDADTARLFAARFGLDRPPNFEDRHWHLHVHRSPGDAAAASGTPAAEATTRLEAARRTLLAARDARVRPGLDDKLLTSWNALAIRGLVLAARALDREDLLRAAEAACARVRRDLWRDGRLLATARAGRAQHNAYLDDYALMAEAALELLQSRWTGDTLDFLARLLDALLERFEDRERGGFWFTSHDHEALIHRPKGFADDATPAGNAVAAAVLLRAGWLLGESRWLRAAERTLRAGWSSLDRYPQGHMRLLDTLEEWLEPPELVVIRGDAAQIERWQRELWRIYAPRRLIFAIPAEATGLPEALASKAPQGEAVAYLCRGPTCSAPITSFANLARDARLRLS